MAFTLIIENGANSYVSEQEADEYFDSQLHSLVWTAAAPESKQRALVMATRTLDSMVDWSGKRATVTQALSWPRQDTFLDGVSVPSDIVPTAVKNATCEVARLLLSGDIRQDVAQNDLASLSLGKGAMAIEFKSDSVKTRVPQMIADILMGLGRFRELSRGGINQRKATR